MRVLLPARRLYQCLGCGTYFLAPRSEVMKIRLARGYAPAQPTHRDGASSRQSGRRDRVGDLRRSPAAPARATAALRSAAIA